MPRRSVIKITGGPLVELLPELRSGLIRLVRQQVRAAKNEIKTQMRMPKSGRWYRRSRGRMHRASAPGEAPAVDSGRLIASLSEMYSNGGLTGSIGSDVDYAGYLETGTRDRKLLPRPYINPAADLAEIAFFNGVDQLINTVFS